MATLTQLEFFVSYNRASTLARTYPLTDLVQLGHSKFQSFIDTAQVDTICYKTTDVYINLNPGTKNVLKFR